MSPARYPDSLARRGPIQKHKHTRAIGSAEKGRPTLRVPRLSPAAPAIVPVQPLPAFTYSGMPDAIKSSMESEKTFLTSALANIAQVCSPSLDGQYRLDNKSLTSRLAWHG